MNILFNKNILIILHYNLLFFYQHIQLSSIKNLLLLYQPISLAIYPSNLYSTQFPPLDPIEIFIINNNNYEKCLIKA